MWIQSVIPKTFVERRDVSSSLWWLSLENNDIRVRFGINLDRVATRFRQYHARRPPYPHHCLMTVELDQTHLNGRMLP